MDIVLNAVEIIDKSSPLHQKRRNVYLKNGVIKKISTKKIVGAKKEVNRKGLKLSTGWFDLGAHFTDPGLEHKEDLISGEKAAKSGGFTGVAVLPNTRPVVQTKNEVAYILGNNKNRIAQLYPMGAVTYNNEGKELTEMIDLNHAGAIAFTDGINPIWHTDILLKSLQYLQKFDGLLINRPEDNMLTAFGSMHEGKQSTLLGLKGMPSLSEEIMIQRDLQLLAYAGGKIHFSNISTSGGVELIRKAKRQGLAVTCDVAVHQLLFSDGAAQDYDTNYKVNPPFRRNEDIKALKKGLKDGTIDLLVSSHRPQDEESKNLEFDLAEFGIIGLQTFLPMVKMAFGEESIDEYIQCFTNNARELLGLDIPEIKEGCPANLTLYDESGEWKYDEGTNYSKSKNSPFWNLTLSGKVIGIFNNGMSFFNPEK